MKRTTTSCENCGYKTRVMQSNMPSIMLDAPLSVCPKCGKLILDHIFTEYEFMTENQRNRFSKKVQRNSITAKGVGTMIIGAFIMIAGIMSGDVLFTVGGVVVGIIFATIGLYLMNSRLEAIDNGACEKLIYVSLRRTRNMDYVRALENAYSRFNDDKIYEKYQNRESFLSKHSYLEQDPWVKERMAQHKQILEALMQGGEEQIVRGKELSFYS